MIKERELSKKDVVADADADADPELQTREEVDQLDLDLASSLKSIPKVSQVLMDDNLMEFTEGKPFPMKHRAKLFFHKAVQNDTLFLSIVNVVDYSIVVGLDENTHEMVVGIIDYLRQVSYRRLQYFWFLVLTFPPFSPNNCCSMISSRRWRV